MIHVCTFTLICVFQSLQETNSNLLFHKIELHLHIQTIFKLHNINSSKKVWKSEFDRLFLPSLSNNRCMLDTNRKII